MRQTKMQRCKGEEIVLEIWGPSRKQRKTANSKKAIESNEIRAKVRKEQKEKQSRKKMNGQEAEEEKREEGELTKMAEHKQHQRQRRQKN